MTIENELLNLISGCLEKDMGMRTGVHCPHAWEPGSTFKSLFPGSKHTNAWAF